MNKNEYLNLYQTRMTQLVHDLRNSKDQQLDLALLEVIKNDLHYLKRFIGRLHEETVTPSNSTPLDDGYIPSPLMIYATTPSIYKSKTPSK